MNQLTSGASSSLVKYLPVARAPVIRNLLLVNGSLFALYLLSSGPYRLQTQHALTATPNSGYAALGLFQSALFCTLGHFHVGRYGAQSFAKVFGLSAAGGSLFTAAGYISGSNLNAQAGAVAPAAGLLAYHALRNAAYIRYGLRPIPVVLALALYGALYGDRAVTGGLTFGYLAFILGF
ncbi:hypothetical protein FGO68_gene6944 [Halteria grandinella]|uniref:Uncharacterized protein n=1 Tax=Halteria grandinella TaxID=5974 RepID=A0A8J8NJC7_HALGN|nr:hypothetical protein FGO68_gene6944 [Halteria grandinella]